jgi:hypothetical protein
MASFSVSRWILGALSSRPRPSPFTLIVYHWALHGTIQSSSAILRRLLAVHMEQIFFTFATTSDWRCSYVHVAFVTAIVNFHKMETIHFNVACWFISMFAIKGRKPILLFLGTCQTSYRHYSARVITAPQLPALARTSSCNSMLTATDGIDIVCVDLLFC